MKYFFPYLCWTILWWWICSRFWSNRNLLKGKLVIIGYRDATIGLYLFHFDDPQPLLSIEKPLRLISIHTIYHTFQHICLLCVWYENKKGLGHITTLRYMDPNPINLYPRSRCPVLCYMARVNIIHYTKSSPKQHLHIQSTSLLRFFCSQ